MSAMGAGERTFSQDPRVLKALEYAFLALLVVRSFSEAFPKLTLPVGPLPVTLSAWVMLLMSGIGLLYLGLLWLRRDWAVDRLGLYFLAWVLSLAPWVYVAAAEWGLSGLSGAREWVRLLSLVLLYLVVWEIARRRGPERVIHACLLALPVPLGLTYYQLLVTPQARAFATTVHPNVLAAFYVAMIALIVWKLVKPDQSLRTRLGWGGLLLVVLIAIIAPISSNAWLMLAVFLIALMLVIDERKFRLAALAIGVGFVIVFLGLFISGHQRVQAEVWQVVSLFGVEVPGWKGGTGTIGWRLEAWRELSGIWAQNPIRGYGLNSVFFLNPAAVGKAAHGDYVRYLVEAGIFGLIFFVLFQIVGGRELFRLAREAPVSSRRLAGIGFALFVAWVVGSIGDNLITSTVFHVYFWSLIACVSAVSSSRVYPVYGASAHSIPKILREEAHDLPYGWLSAVVSLPDEGGPTCRRCHLQAFTAGALICRRCLLPLSWGKASLLFGLSLVVSSLIGFYLWNQGAGLETFYLGWFLWYVLLALVARHSQGYLWGLMLAVLVGLAVLPALFPVLSQGVFVAASAAFLGVIGLALYGVWASIWRVNQVHPLLGAEVASRSLRTRFMDIMGPLVAVAAHYLRCYLLPLGMMVLSAIILNFLLQRTSDFLYGDAWAIGEIGASVVAIFTVLWLFMWGLTRRSLQATLVDLGLSYLFLLLTVQISAWIATAALWAASQLLPLFPSTERFAPLLLYRSPGLYTWISLGIFIFGLGWWLLQRLKGRTLPQGRKGRTTASFDRQSER